MLKKRIAPIILIKDSSIVKTVKFQNARIVGDLKSTIQVFAIRLADEICVIDIEARKNKKIKFEIVEDVAKLANMPLTYGGYINSLSSAKKLYDCGVDKLMLRTLIFENTKEVQKISDWFGYQSIIACVDYVGHGIKAKCVFGHDNKISSIALFDYVKNLSKIGVGEILNCIDKDGMMTGYIETLKEIKSLTNLPIIISGGCGNIEHIKNAFSSSASAIAAGSLFYWIGESIISVKQELHQCGIPVRLK